MDLISESIAATYEHAATCLTVPTTCRHTFIWLTYLERCHLAQINLQLLTCIDKTSQQSNLYCWNFAHRAILMQVFPYRRAFPDSTCIMLNSGFNIFLSCWVCNSEKLSVTVQTTCSGRFLCTHSLIRRYTARVLESYARFLYWLRSLTTTAMRTAWLPDGFVLVMLSQLPCILSWPLVR